MVTTVFEPLVLGAARTGALDISMKTRRVISVPTQLGCNVGCTFCISRGSPSTTNLSAVDMISVVDRCFESRPDDGRPVDLSFTGEGEALVNMREAAHAARRLVARHSAITSLRISFSGFQASRLLPRVFDFPLPVRLQFSLHAAQEQVRQAMMPRSERLAVVLQALRDSLHRFHSIELNVALQDGVNDSDADLAALAAWGEPDWPILLNPLLTNEREVVAQRTALFESSLRAAGRDVRRYEAVAASISKATIYPHMTASRVVIPINSAAPSRLAPDRLAA
jgi:hypothetical protein